MGLDGAVGRGVGHAGQDEALLLLVVVEERLVGLVDGALLRTETQVWVWGCGVLVSETEASARTQPPARNGDTTQHSAQTAPSCDGQNTSPVALCRGSAGRKLLLAHRNGERAPPPCRRKRSRRPRGRSTAGRCPPPASADTWLGVSRRRGRGRGAVWPSHRPSRALGPVPGPPAPRAGGDAPPPRPGRTHRPRR